jgi:hypothetical protein
VPRTERERLEEEIRQEKQEVARFMEQLAVRDADLLQLVIQKIEQKEHLHPKTPPSREEQAGDGEWEMERIMQEELREEEARMERQLMKSMGVATPSARSPSESFAP